MNIYYKNEGGQFNLRLAYEPGASWIAKNDSS